MSLTPPMSPRVVDARLQGLLKQLRLPTVAKNYETLARQAAESGQPYPEYLMALLERELSQRDVNRRRRLLRQARFPITYSLDTYDFTLMPSLSKPKVLELASGDFISKAQNVVLLGQIGTGKTHVATALGYAACESGYKVRFFTAAALISQLLEAHEQNRLSRLENSLLKQHLIIIDELGFVPFSQQGAQMLFTFISQRYQRPRFFKIPGFWAPYSTDLPIIAISLNSGVSPIGFDRVRLSMQPNSRRPSPTNLPMSWPMWLPRR